MLSVLASILPKYCEFIASGIKTVEVRKTRPKIETPFKCYIYCTKAKDKALLDGYTFFADELYIDHWSKTLTCGHTQFEEIVNGKVIGEFVCDNIEIIKKTDYHPNYYFTRIGTCLEPSEMWEYGKGKPLYAWHISDLIIYDKPKELSEFRKSGALSYDDWLYGMYNGTSESSYEKYLLPFALTRPPQSWCYIEK